MALNEQEAKIRWRYKLSPNQSEKDVPLLPKGVFYLILLDFGWNTPNAEAVRSNKQALGDKIGEHLLLELTTEEQRNYFSDLFDIKRKTGPFVVICDSHPKSHRRGSSKTTGITVDFSKIEEAEIVPLFHDIVDAIDQPGFVKSVKWKYRLSMIKKRLKGKGLLSIVLRLFDI
jgi:hypothetical protein